MEKSKNILTSKYFWGTISALVVFGFIVLWRRYEKCKKDNCIDVQCVTAPCPPECTPCSFWTGKAIVKQTSPNAIDDNEGKPIEAGKVDLWCANGKYYKRTSTTVYGQPELLELSQSEFNALVAQGISYSGCAIQ